VGQSKSATRSRRPASRAFWQADCSGLEKNGRGKSGLSFFISDRICRDRLEIKSAECLQCVRVKAAARAAFYANPVTVVQARKRAAQLPMMTAEQRSYDSDRIFFRHVL
jgi:hypothetical protein